MASDPLAPRAISPSRSDGSTGLIAGLTAYFLWGMFPLYFDALRPTGPWEILADRILFTLVICAAVLLLRRDLPWIAPLRRQPRLVAGLVVAAFLIATNWIVYVSAVTSGHTSDAALGYFLNPLVTVALGVVVLRERLRPLQWIAVAVGVVAAGYLTVTGGRFPLTALVLACSFGLYGLAKKKVGAHLGALHGLTVESAVLTPAAGLMLLGVGLYGGGLQFARNGAGTATLLALSGVTTAIPLVLFALAAQRIPLVTVGLIQFITPVMQLLCAVLLLGEHLPAERWVGFAIVWLALLLLTADSMVALRRRSAVSPPGGRPVP